MVRANKKLLPYPEALEGVIVYVCIADGLKGVTPEMTPVLLSTNNPGNDGEMANEEGV